MLRYLPRQEWEKRKLSFYKKEQPKYGWLKQWGKEDQRVPSGMNPSFGLSPWGLEDTPTSRASSWWSRRCNAACLEEVTMSPASSGLSLWERGRTPGEGITRDQFCPGTPSTSPEQEHHVESRVPRLQTLPWLPCYGFLPDGTTERKSFHFLSPYNFVRKPF